MKNKVKKSLSLLLIAVLLFTALPIIGISTTAATSYDIPAAGDVAWIKTSDYATRSDTGARYAAVVNGVTHSIRNATFRPSGYGGVNGNYNPDLQLYCIEFGVGYSSNPKYTAYAPSAHSYWKGLSQTAREGVLLSIGFGYPASSLSTLGVAGEGDALAATQILIWEFETGRRTAYSGNAADPVLYTTCIQGKPAETAYWKILALAKAYKEDARYSFATLETQSQFVLWSLSSYQTMLCYSLPDEYPEYQNGSIEVYKADSSTGANPMQTKLKLYKEWGIELPERPYLPPKKAGRAVTYADRQMLIEAISQKYPELVAMAAAKQAAKATTQATAASKSGRVARHEESFVSEVFEDEPPKRMRIRSPKM